MKVQISRLMEEPGAAKAFDFLLPPEEIRHEEYRLLTPLRVCGNVINTGNELCLKGTLTTRLAGSCSRCLGPVTQDFRCEFDELYDYGEFAEEDSLDVAEVAREYFIASLPLKVLCSDDCPGLCPICGKPLADGECGCVKKETDPRLAALKKLLD
ncbi:MAG: DUF177 domain-containing protein [Peptococcaceae bacterium]|nr:DUF177 domain-containing protein [Peptococcaceae bacterium]